MSRTTRSTPFLLLPLLLVAALLALGLSVGTGGAASAGAAAEASGRPDPALRPGQCALMDRVYTAAGCSRTQCRQRGESIRYSPNAETCTIGGRNGTSYGSEIDSRVCAQLHRVWVAPVNFCASNPHRDRTLITHAPQCVRPFTTYVTTSRTNARRATRAEAEDRYDVCLRPHQAIKLQREADRTGRSLRKLAVDESSILCGLQPQRAYVGGRCVVQPGTQSPTVLMVGDSLTWRGTDELADLRPDWVVDGASGRNLGSLGERLDRFSRSRGAPTGLVVALGTNPSPGFTLADLRAVVSRLAPTTPVMVVSPFRRSGVNRAGQVRGVDRAATLLSQLVAERPRTCLADWRALVTRQPGLLVDGTHQTRHTEGLWADFVSSGWQTCLGQTP